jgi:hypothetical protein
MKTSLLLPAALLVIIISCSKDKFTTIPQVTVKSISPTTVFKGDVITMKAKYTDKEGDIDTVFVIYKWYNGATVVKKDTFKYPFSTLNVPAKTQEADMEVTFEYHTNNNPDLRFLPGVPRDTTATLGLILKDKAANKSIYSESKPIRLIKP